MALPQASVHDVPLCDPCTEDEPPPLAERGRRHEASAAALADAEFWHMFSGPARPGEFSSVVREAGHVARDWDRLRDAGHELASDAFFKDREADAMAGKVAFLLGGPPCDTWSVGNEVPLRPLGEEEGAAWLSPAQRERVQGATLLLERLCHLALLVWRRMGGFLIEQPAARYIFGTPFFWAVKSQHSSIMDMPCVKALCAATGARWVFAPHCAFADELGGPGDPRGVGIGAQKWSMYLISPEALPCFPRLRHATCLHDGHSESAWGVDEHGHGRAKGYAAYSQGLSRVMGEGAVAFVRRKGESVEGEMHWGAALHPEVRSAIREAVEAAPRFASFRKRAALPADQRWCQPMPPEADLEPPLPEVSATVARQRCRPPQQPDDETLAEAGAGERRPAWSGGHGVPEEPALKIAYWMIWLPADGHEVTRSGLDLILEWRGRAAQAQACIRRGERAERVPTLVVPASLKHPRVF